MSTCTEADNYKVAEKFCPYCNVGAETCSASLTSMSLGILMKLNYCDSDNYDNCATFLAKSLRRR